MLRGVSRAIEHGPVPFSAHRIAITDLTLTDRANPDAALWTPFIGLNAAIESDDHLRRAARRWPPTRPRSHAVSFVYHLCAADFRGTTLYPLKNLQHEMPDVYEREHSHDGGEGRPTSPTFR